MEGENRVAFTPLRHEGVNRGLIRFHSRQSHILDTDQVDVRQSPQQAAHDVVVEVLVTQ